MRRDARAVKRAPHEEDERGVSARAWGVVLGGWIVLFTVLAFVGVPVLFSLCEVNR